MSRLHATWLVGICMLVAADQSTKAWARTHAAVMVCNSGAAFGSFQGSAHWLGILSLLAVGVFAWASRGASKERLLGYGLLLAGTCGNLVDRLARGCVTDFLEMEFLPFRFPLFNLADIYLNLGILALILLPRILEAWRGHQRRCSSSH